MRRTKRYTLDEILDKFREIHGDKYDYSNIKEYINNKQYIYPICSEHGVFKIRVCKHLQGQKCSKCAGNSKMTTEKCIELSRKVHGSKYDYSLVECNGRHKKIDIICPKHGVFSITPNDHITNKQGCKYCARERTSERCLLNENEIIKRIKDKHPEWIIDNNFKYRGMFNKVTIKCPLHGYFSKTPNHILWMDIGCPKCHTYNLEEEVKNLLEKHNIKYEFQKTFDWLIYKRNQFLDFYLPDYNIGIECQGIQHFKSIGMFDEDKVNENQKRDKNKLHLCNEHGIKILYYTDKRTYNKCKNDDLIIDGNKLINIILEYKINEKEIVY